MNPINSRKEPALDTLNQIQLAIKSSGVYPENHPISCEIIKKSYASLIAILNKNERLDVSVSGGKLLVNDLPMESNNTLSSNFAFDLDQRAISSISFLRGLSRRDFMVFIHAMNQKAKSKANNVDSILKSRGISAIRLNGVKYQKVTGDLNDKSQLPMFNEFGLNDDSKGAADDHRPQRFEESRKSPASGLHQKQIEFETVTFGDQDTGIPAAESGTNEGKGKTHGRENLILGGKQDIKAYVNDLISDGNGEKIGAVIDGLSKRMNDKSQKIRQKVAESLQDITSTLDDLDKLNENFQKITGSLVDWVKRESHVDTYLAVTENLHRVCASQGKLDSYLIDDTIGGRLFQAQKLSKAMLQKALRARKKDGISLQYSIGALNLVDEAALTHCLAQQYYDCREAHLSGIVNIGESILKTVPEKYIERYKILPFETKYGSLYIATLAPNDWQVFKDVQFISGYPIVPHLAAEYYLLNSIEKFYGLRIGPAASRPVSCSSPFENWKDDLEFVEDNEDGRSQTEELTDSDVPIIRLVNMIIREAIEKKASDIHIEPYENELRVRFRIDGSLITALNPSARYTSGLASRIKIMSGLDISERRLPQDGRFKVGFDKKYVTFRVSTFPSAFGEKIVLRLLDEANLALDVDQLGLNKKDLKIILSSMQRSNGMMLITGPTGSGKTTTIYSILRRLNDGSQNIATAEDPIEYNLKGINQFQMNPKIGLNFARALRTFLRQDPDIIMVGEIRDFETAEISFKAALTGHLVLSTLHTNNAPETITRLLNMGVEPYIITSSINVIVAQRLLRKICKHCKTPVAPTELQESALEANGLALNGYQFYTGEGCDACNDTGYRGRTAIYEVMPLWDEVRELIIKGKSTAEIKAKAEELGLISLQKQGFNKVATGVTTLSEWMRVLA